MLNIGFRMFDIVKVQPEFKEVVDITYLKHMTKQPPKDCILTVKDDRKIFLGVQRHRPTSVQ